MIQRKQSLYLALAAVAALIIPFSGGPVTPDAWTWYTPTKVAVSLLITVGSLVAVFLYGDRRRQRGLVTLIAVLSVGLLATLLVAVLVSGPIVVLESWPVLCSLVAAVLLFLARRAITSDIELVRSMDRLR